MRNRCRNSTPSLAAKFTATSVPTAAFGSAPAISPAKIGGPARRKRASLRPRKSPRTGTCSFAESSAMGTSRAKRPFRQVSEHYLRDYDIMTQGQRNKKYLEFSASASAGLHGVRPAHEDPGYCRYAQFFAARRTVSLKSKSK